MIDLAPRYQFCVALLKVLVTCNEVGTAYLFVGESSPVIQSLGVNSNKILTKVQGSFKVLVVTHQCLLTTENTFVIKTLITCT